MKTNSITAGEGISLHAPKEELAPAIFKLISDHRIYMAEWLPWVAQTNTIADTISFIKDAQRWNVGGQQFNTIIKYKKEVAGIIGYNKIIKSHQQGEIGYWLGKPFQGKGIITQACDRLIHYGFRHLNLRKVVIKVASQNQKSKKIPKKLGFQLEGVLRKDIKIYDQFLDLEIYGILKEEYYDENTRKA